MSRGVEGVLGCVELFHSIFLCADYVLTGGFRFVNFVLWGGWIVA